MAARAKDPTEAIRLQASRYPGVDEGTACTQSSFRAGKKSFLFVGMQGGRYKAMFKLKASLPQAAKLAAADPDDFQVGSWVTTRFTAAKPLPKRIWSKWLDESYALAIGSIAPKKKKTKKKVAKKAAAKKKARPRKKKKTGRRKSS